MALFKPFRGNRTALDAQPLHDGYAYFCVDDGTFHIDYVDADGNLQRKQLNAKDAETLSGMSLEEIKTYLVTQPDWNQTDATRQDYIKNKPTHIVRDVTASIIGGILTLTQICTYAASVVNGVLMLTQYGSMTSYVVDDVLITTQIGSDYTVSVTDNILIIS